MGSIADEFESFIEDDNEPICCDYMADSKKNIEKAKNIRALETIYGINAITIYKLMTFGATNYIPWEHVTFYIDTNKLIDINGELISELRIFDFVEELGVADGTDIGFGFNNSHRNKIKAITIPANMTVLDNKIFAFYKNLKSITFEDNCKLLRLGTEAFAYCENLHMIDLRNCEELEELPANMLEYSAVKVLKLSSKLLSIDKDAFNQSSLKYVYIDNDKYDFDDFYLKLKENNFNSFWETMDSFDF